MISLNRISKKLLLLQRNELLSKNQYWLRKRFGRLIFTNFFVNYFQVEDIEKRTEELFQREIELIKKLSLWPKTIELAARNLEPHRIPYYLYDLSSSLHSYWNLGKEDSSFKIIENPDINLVHARVFLLNKILSVIKSGLSILGVNAPETM